MTPPHALQPYRPLESFSLVVLMEYIRRRSWFPSELERIEREFGFENGKATSAVHRFSVAADDVRLEQFVPLAPDGMVLMEREPVSIRAALRGPGVELGEGRSLVGATMPERGDGRDA